MAPLSNITLIFLVFFFPPACWLLTVCTEWTLEVWLGGWAGWAYDADAGGLLWMAIWPTWLTTYLTVAWLVDPIMPSVEGPVTGFLVSNHGAFDMIS